VLARFHRGLVIVISPHFEANDNTAEIISYAVHWMYDHRER